MIHAVRFRNFKALRDVEVGLDRCTVLVGPNASGKTSVLEGLHHLSRLASTDPREVFVGRASLGLVASRGAAGTFELGLTGTFREKPGDLGIAFSAIEDFPFSDTYSFASRWGERRFTIRRELSTPADATAVETLEGTPGSEMGLGSVLREAAYLRFDLDRLAEASYSDLATPVIEADGSCLAATVADMAVARPEAFGRLQDALRAVIPGLQRVRLTRSRVPRVSRVGVQHAVDEEQVWGHEIVLDMAGASDLPARAASEGVLRMLGLFAVLLSADRPDLILIDHLERGLNPRSFGELAAQLGQILDLHPELQIVATSDSAALLDHLGADAVRVHCLLEDGSVRVKPLVLHPEHAALVGGRGELRPGEFWMQVGDDWVAEEPRLIAPGPPPLPVSAAPPIETHAWPPDMPPLPTGTGRQ